MTARISLGGISLILACGLLTSCSESHSTLGVTAQAATVQPSPRPEGFERAPQTAGGLPESASCFNDVEFLEDLTVPDGSVFPPAGLIDKRWSVRNNGTCNWTSDYRLVRLDQDPIQSPQEVALYPARAGALGIWQVVFTAPSEPGEYMTRWQASSPAGELFGQEVFMLIRVDPAGAQPSQTETLIPTQES